MAQFRTSRRFDIAFVVVLLALLWLAALNRTSISDWLFFLRFQPTTQTTEAATQAGLSNYGRRLLYRTDPQFSNLATINAVCDTERLGCLVKGRAYILSDPANPDQAVVTAAHEMLHLAYQRLSKAQKDALYPSLDQAMSDNLIGGLQDELSGQDTVADRRDEAHSLLGTEYKKLPAALEAYYAQYFTDRAKVLAAYDRSQQ